MLKQRMSEEAIPVCRPVLPETGADAVAVMEPKPRRGLPLAHSESLRAVSARERRTARWASLTGTGQVVASFLTLACFASLCLILFLLEMPVSLAMLRTAAGLFGLGSLLCLFPLRRAKALLCVGTAAGLITLTVLTWIPTGSPRHAFLRHFERVQPGMTLAEVRNAMGPRHPLQQSYGQEADVPSDFSGTLYIGSHTPQDGGYNADVAYIDFRNGRVVRTDFSPD
jgi:hypothetical protein